MSDPAYYFLHHIAKYFLQHYHTKHSVCSLLPGRQHYRENTFPGNIHSGGNNDSLHSPLCDNKIGGRCWSATGDNPIEVNDYILSPCTCAQGSFAVKNG